jgi:hypothetical protein
VLRARRPNGLWIVGELEQLDDRGTGFSHELNRSSDRELDHIVDDHLSRVS